MDKKEYAVQLKHSGYNCCQAVLCAFAEEAGMNEDELKRIGAWENISQALHECLFDR